eukprot:4918399-Ditylum_brightwellii.AAC.1
MVSQKSNPHHNILSSPDFDVQIHLEETSKKPNVKWPIEHVKGRQQGQHLTWEANLTTWLMY